ncbi:MAG: hypothetical protein RXO36_04750 [Candidatus Nanopusillus acidilobi]
MNLCNYNMNVGLLGVAREVGAIITGYETYYKFHKKFSIEVERPPYFYNTDIDFDWISVENKDMLFVSGIDFNAKMEPIVYHFYIFTFPPKILPSKIQLYFNPK